MRLLSNQTILRVTLCLSILVLHTILYHSSWGTRVDNFLQDAWFKIRGSIPAPAEVLIISMDEASYQNLDIPMNQGWPRALHTRLLKKLKDAGVTRVAFDVLFLGPGQDPTVDQDLAKAFSEVPSVIGADQGERESAYGTTVELLMPNPLFSKSVEEVALVGLPEEFDRVRHFRLPDLESDVTQGLRPLAFAAANTSSQAIPKVEDSINYYGPAGSIPSYSYYQVLEEEVPFPLERLKGKTVFVGLQLRSDVGPEQKDSFLTAFPERGRTYGVEIHATAAANLLQKNWIKRYPKDLELWCLNALLLLVCIICVYMPPLRGAYILSALSLLWGISSYFAFEQQTFLPGLTVFAICLPFTYLVSTLTSYLIARHSQRQLEKAFGFYLSPHMAKYVSKNSGALALGGEKVQATALFTDIAGFTSLSETMSAEEVVNMLNAYFTELAEGIFENGGTLIKFIGDSLFAIWGAPVKTQDHAAAALRAARSMQKNLANSVRLQPYPKLPTRIGIHTGPMVVGNLGSSKRFDFTAIGDAVNVASRIEGLNKYLGTSLLCTDAIVNEIPERDDLFYMGKVKLVGKNEYTSLYTIFSLPEIRESAEIWKDAVNDFEKRKWMEALQGFSFCKEKFAYLSKAAQLYLDDIERFLITPPDDDWEGALVAKAK